MIGVCNPNECLIQDAKRNSIDVDTVCFSSLPDECLYIIFSNLPLYELVYISRTCRKFRRLCLDSRLWKSTFNSILLSLYPTEPLNTISRKMTRKASMEGLLNAVAPFDKDYTSIRKMYMQLTTTAMLGNCTPQHATTNVWDTKINESNLVWGTRPPSSVKVVLCGNLDCLIQVLTCVEEIDLQFVKAFLMTFESFTSIEMFFVKLMQRYQVPSSTKSLYSSTEEWQKELVLPVRFRVVNILKMLIEKVSLIIILK